MTYKIRIEQDDCPESPREWDNLGTMVCFHGRYNLGDKSTLNQEEVQDIYRNDKEYISLPLYLYDHSGLTMNTTGFSCPWDSGQVGVIFVSRAKVRSEYGVKRISKAIEEKVIRCLKGEVENYDMYLRGDIWGYIIEEDVTYTSEEGKTIVVPEEVDSCWGFYGYDECEAEAKAIVESMEAKVAA